MLPGHVMAPGLFGPNLLPPIPILLQVSVPLSLSLLPFFHAASAAERDCHRLLIFGGNEMGEGLWAGEGHLCV